MITVKEVFDKLHLPQSDHVRSYIGVLVSDKARTLGVKIDRTLENGIDFNDEHAYLVNSYPDDFEIEIRRIVLEEPKQKRPRIQFKKV